MIPETFVIAVIPILESFAIKNPLSAVLLPSVKILLVVSFHINNRVLLKKEFDDLPTLKICL
jgi:hypothetical protein